MAHLENLGSDVLVHVRVSASKAPVVIRTASSLGVGGFRVGDAVGVRTGRRLLAFDRDGTRIGVLHTGGLDEATATSQVAHA